MYTCSWYKIQLPNSIFTTWYLAGDKLRLQTNTYIKYIKNSSQQSYFPSHDINISDYFSRRSSHCLPCLVIYSKSNVSASKLFSGRADASTSPLSCHDFSRKLLSSISFILCRNYKHAQHQHLLRLHAVRHRFSVEAARITPSLSCCAPLKHYITRLAINSSFISYAVINTSCRLQHNHYTVSATEACSLRSAQWYGLWQNISCGQFRQRAKTFLCGSQWTMVHCDCLLTSPLKYSYLLTLCS